MIRLAKYLKPFLPLILLSIVLLFVQGMADLSLPDYIAKIVNTGIQQGGIGERSLGPLSDSNRDQFRPRRDSGQVLTRNQVRSRCDSCAGRAVSVEVGLSQGFGQGRAGPSKGFRKLAVLVDDTQRLVIGEQGRPGLPGSA